MSLNDDLSREEIPVTSVIPDVTEKQDLIRQPSINSFSEDGPSDVEHDEEDSPLGNEVSKKETKDVLYLKLLVLFILVISASTIAGCVYVYITRNETAQFESKFKNDADKVLVAIGSSLHRTMGLLDSLAVTYVSYAQDQNDSWPFVTLPDFGARMAKLLPLTDAISISLLPIVYPEERKEWEAYSLSNDHWVNESIATQETWDSYYGPINYDWEPYGYIYGDSGDIEANISRMMLPWWQNFPVISSVGYKPYNWDWLNSAVPDPMHLCISLQRGVTSSTYNIPDPNPEVNEETEFWVEWFRSLIPPDENPFEPVFDLYFPIINNISHVDVSTISSSHSANDTIVAVLSVTIYWRNFIREILPTGSNGIFVVVECPCNAAFTYQINGSEVNYLGVGDGHDVKYNDLAKTSKLVDLNTLFLRESLYSGPPLDESYCPYTIHLYPSDLMKADFTTKNGVIFMVSTICIFIFTSLVFYLYDWKVERRQNRVVVTARRSSALLSSLFPATVRDQLYQTQSDDNKVKENTWSLPMPFKGSDISNEQDTGKNDPSPIAQLYTDTTVIFMDIVGFTHWSSTRQPTAVFQLLESIYGKFDALAKVYGVFKIETIGDSYVAVVGLPVKRKRHAVIMARFANACRAEMKEVVMELEEALGEGTADLTLRIGLNSGPTTAGVLRGEKARFQLFGDTVNTAARMESNGEPCKIHVSPSTAFLIQSAGYEHWLMERLDKVEVKGKGLMQTYWCEPQESNEGKSSNGSEAQY